MNPAQLISQGRSMALGFATLCILLFHQRFIPDSRLLMPFSYYGAWGVEIFLFLSGFGIYYSLSNAPSTLRLFYSKRLIRILPPAIMVGCLINLLNPFFDNALVAGKLPYGLTQIAILSGLHLWYIRAILLFYLFSPLLFRILRRPIWLVTILLCISTIGITLSQFSFFTQNQHIYTSIVWPLLRFPSYLLGMKIADFFHCKSSASYDSLTHYGILVLIITLGTWCVILTYPHVVLYFILPPIAATVCILFGKIQTVNLSHAFSRKLHFCICQALAWIGSRSLEFYLIHMSVYSALLHLHPEPTAWQLPVSWLIIALITIPVRIAAARISSRLMPSAPHGS